jgi:hypothetical protein
LFSKYKKTMITVLLFLAVLLMIVAVCLQCPSCEKYSPVTGFSYADGCDKMPVPENIRTSSKSPPFYNLNAVRSPLCAYRNFTFPPPMGYTPIKEAPADFDIYQYWFKDAVLSHPQTAYLV